MLDSPFSVRLIAEICPACTAPKVLTLLFSPVGYTWPRPRLPPAYNGYVKYFTSESFSGSGATTGKISSWCFFPAIGPTTRILSNSVLYGEIKTPLFFCFTSSGIWLFGANLKPFGKITIPPTFKSAFLPFAPICWRDVSYGTLTSTSNTEFGSTACGASISIAFWFKWQLAQANFPFAARGFE